MAPFDRPYSSSYSSSIVNMSLSIFYRYWNIQRRMLAWPCSLGNGRRARHYSTCDMIANTVPVRWSGVTFGYLISVVSERFTYCGDKDPVSFPSVFSPLSSFRFLFFSPMPSEFSRFCHVLLRYSVDAASSRRYCQRTRLVVWLSGNALTSINVVALRQTRLVPAWVTVCGRVNHFGM